MPIRLAPICFWMISDIWFVDINVSWFKFLSKNCNKRRNKNIIQSTLFLLSFLLFQVVDYLVLPVSDQMCWSFRCKTIAHYSLTTTGFIQDLIADRGEKQIFFLKHHCYSLFGIVIYLKAFSSFQLPTWLMKTCLKYIKLFIRSYNFCVPLVWSFTRLCCWK